MTAISVKGYRSPLTHGKPHRHRLEVLVHNLIILCTVLSIVLSSIAVCDGNWLQTPGGRWFGLWRFCNTDDGRSGRSAPHCITPLSQSGVEGVEVGMVCCRALVSMAVVVAIFGLEFQVISRLSEGEDSARRWVLGSGLMLVAACMSAAGVAVFAALFRGFVSPASISLTFWCQITAVSLFLLNGTAARYVRDVNTPAPSSSTLQKC